VSAGLCGGVSDLVCVEAALLRQDQQTAEQLASLGAGAWSMIAVRWAAVSGPSVISWMRVLVDMAGGL